MSTHILDAVHPGVEYKGDAPRIHMIDTGPGGIHGALTVDGGAFDFEARTGGTQRSGTFALAFRVSGGDLFFPSGTAFLGQLLHGITANRAWTFPDIAGTVLVTSIASGKLTQGSIPFADSNGLLAQDNSNLFWDDSNNRLGVGTIPNEQIHITDVMQIDEKAGDPGGTANAGKIYTKDVAGVTELFYQRSDGTVVQIT